MADGFPVTNLSVIPRKRLENQSSRAAGACQHNSSGSLERRLCRYLDLWLVCQVLALYFEKLLSLSFFFCEKGIIKPALPECCLYMHSNSTIPDIDNTHRMRIIIFLKLIYFNWRIITLQYCDGFLFSFLSKVPSFLLLSFPSCLESFPLPFTNSKSVNKKML